MSAIAARGPGLIAFTGMLVAIVGAGLHAEHTGDRYTGASHEMADVLLLVAAAGLSAMTLRGLGFPRMTHVLTGAAGIALVMVGAIALLGVGPCPGGAELSITSSGRPIGCFVLYSSMTGSDPTVSKDLIAVIGGGLLATVGAALGVAGNSARRPQSQRA